MFDKQRDGCRASRNWQRKRPEAVPVGEARSTTKLTEAIVKQIRDDYATDTFYQREIAARYGVTQMLVSKIVHRHVWKHV